jgi:CRISPR-associated protein Csx17
MNSIPITGSRHDILGHHLKAIGLLRVLAACAEPEHCDVEAEGWWELDSACFHLCSEKYSDEDKLVEFFVEHYRPTAIFSPWNTGGGLDDKQEIVLKIDHQPVEDFLRQYDGVLREHGYDPGEGRSQHSWKMGELKFDLKSGEFSLNPPEGLEFHLEETTGKRPKRKVVIKWAPSVLEGFQRFLRENLAQLEEVANIPKSVRASLEQGQFSNEELCLTVRSLDAARNLNPAEGIICEIRTKTSGEKATISVVYDRMSFDTGIIRGIEAGRRRFPDFQSASTSEQRRELLESFRDELSDLGILAMDSVLTSRTGHASDNPIFLGRGKAGNSEIFRAFWSYFLAFQDRAADLTRTSLFPGHFSVWDKEKSPGTPFFPDAIKTYNNGLGWVVATFPFNALDYLLAVEGALALRGTASRTLAANSRRFAAFPFVFDSGEDLVDDSGDIKGTASSIWLPLWNRPATFAELSSFIGDAQARLPGKEARFSAEFARALRIQGVDAGFASWQEFRFKMKASRVPWVCTGRYLGPTSDRRPLELNDALAPLDECGFLDQFEPRFKGNKVDSRSPHPIRSAINSVIEEAVTAPSSENALAILSQLYPACQKLAQSNSFRETLRRSPVFFDPLPQRSWEYLLEGMVSPEFRIARALASIAGFSIQANGEYSEVQPFLGSLLPLNLDYGRCQLEKNSKQAVWSASDLSHDLARTLSRRYLDSLRDNRPALMSCRPARLADILAFLNGELNDNRIARWTEALSLISWHWDKKDEGTDSTLSGEEQSTMEEANTPPAIPPAYAALRSLLEVECEWQGNDASLWKKRRSQRPISLLCQRVPSSLALAVEAALHWLSVWGVRNCWGDEARIEKPRLQGREVIDIDHRELDFNSNSLIVSRLAAAVLIPLDWRDRWTIFRAVTLPQTVKR